MLTRRRLIGLVGIGLFSALFGGIRIPQKIPTSLHSLTLKFISKRHAAILMGVFSGILAVQDQLTLVNSILKADQILGKFTPWARFELMGALEVLEQSPLWAIGSLKKFSELEENEQMRVLKSWSSGLKPGRALTQGLKEFSVFVYYSQDQSWSEIGYEGPLVHRL